MSSLILLAIVSPGLTALGSEPFPEGHNDRTIADGSSEEKVVDSATGKTYDVYDGDCLYEPETDYYYEPFENFPSERERTERCEDTFIVNGKIYIPKRCYRNGGRLQAELGSYGFDVIFHDGEEDENSICVHKGSGTD